MLRWAEARSRELATTRPDADRSFYATSASTTQREGMQL
jgi:hypothetical protein